VFVFLWTTTSVFNKNTGAKKVAQLEQTSQEQAETIEQMTADQQQAEQLLLAARDALENQEVQIANQQIQAENLANAYEEQLSQLTANQAELAKQIASLTEQLQLATTENQIISEQGAEDRQEILDQANYEIDELNARIAELENALAQSEAIAKQKEIEYVEMSNRLNKALAEKVAELNDKIAELSSLSQYQSEFYKQVKIALGDWTNIKQDGDRFIVSSDILFPSGSYKISADGQAQLKLLAKVIKDFESKIPSDIDWIIRVDGHTDNKPVLPDTVGYKNNMQLSLLRATAVVNELVKNGVSKRRLIPSGFGEMHPVELGKDAASLQKNRRIELQLTNK
jgi:chemotaxis protein MotB